MSNDLPLCPHCREAALFWKQRSHGVTYAECLACGEWSALKPLKLDSPQSGCHGTKLPVKGVVANTDPHRPASPPVPNGTRKKRNP